ncbi:MAG: hypothetical protein JW779_08910 [Candidatus Thorarchaeota archaeon]|nr:hypothetical protein [Candidatus Thorarchaeota archaeon]
MTEMPMLSETDEYVHDADKKPNWRESYYFNWVDLDAGVSGFSTIGLLPNIGKREFVFTLFYDHDKREVHFEEPSGNFSGNLSEALSDGTLRFDLTKPLKEWRITYLGKNLKADIVWPGRFPVYDFGSGSGTSWSGHFEQSGSPHGTLTFSDGRILKFNGLGQRDKSWGSRDWHIESWFALHAQFDNLSIGLRRDLVKGTAYPSGGISSLDAHIPIERIELTTETHPNSGIPIGAKTTILDHDGIVYTLRSQLISSNSYVRFTREFPEGRTDLYEGMAIHQCEELGLQGTGLIEWLFTQPTK